MPVIRVSQQTWERLQRHARPLEHTANDVVEMALNALEAQVKWGGSLHAKNTALTKKKISGSKSRANFLSIDFEFLC